VAGHIPLMFVDLGPALGLIQAGKVRPLGVSTRTRVPQLPDVPPIFDSLAGFDAASWQMIVAPARTPPPTVARLHADLNDVLALPEIREGITKAGMGLQESRSVDGLREFIRSEIARWGKVVQQAGIAGSQ
jgi:tripartite-type tricarboxylate transporter receptor subunit TctC